MDIISKYNIDERNKMSGSIIITKMTKAPVFDDKGNILNTEDVVHEEKVHNTIVYAGRAQVAQIMSDASYNDIYKITKFALGYDPAEIPPSPTDVDLNGQKWMDDITQYTQPSSVSRMFTTVVPAGEAEGQWNEIALKLNDATNTLWSRATYSTQQKDPDIFLIFRWVVVF